MKLLNASKTLVILMLIVLTAQGRSYGQEISIPVTLFDSMQIDIVKGTQAILDLQTYKASNEKLKKEVDRKEGVIVSQINKNKLCYALADSLQGLMRTKDEIIETQTKVIQKQGKVKRWALGVGIGYGYAFLQKPMMQPFIYIGIQRNIFRF